MEIFVNLSILIFIAVLVSGITKLLKQPLIVGYIISGILVGPYFLNLVGENPVIGTFSKIGIILLLFMVGLHLNPKVIKDVGGISLATGLGQVIFTSLIGFFIAKLFGLSNISAVYVSFALTLSSTIIIMKLLSDKKDLETLYGKIAVGFLIVQDFIAIFALMFISSLSDGANVYSIIFWALIKGVFAVGVVFSFGLLVLPKFTSFIAKSQEFLLLFSIGWCFAIASLFQYSGFSVEIGALLAGVTLSLSPCNKEISSKMKPLRDFFIILFFILLGSQMALEDVTSNLALIIVFSLFILIGNPLIVIILMGIFGYTKRTSFLAGLTVAQISEFSLVMITLGVSIGHLSSEILSIVTAVGLITIGISAYMIIYSNKIYSYLSGPLSFFEKDKLRERKTKDKDYNAILFGYNRIGFNILNSLKRIKKDYVVIDFNPETIKNLSKLRIPCMYGDAYDSEFLEELPLDKIEIAISTIPDFEINFLLIESIRRVNPDAIIILRAHSIEEALNLYKKGATYVLTPHFLGGEYVAKMIEFDKMNKVKYKEEREKHIKNLFKMQQRGHEHPEVERN